jgi:hypothetical protein
MTGRAHAHWLPALVAALASCATVSAQEAAAPAAWTYRVRVGNEAGATRANSGSPFRGLTGGSLWDGSSQLVATGDATWTPGERLQAGAGVALAGDSDTGATVRLRQAYVRLSPTAWLDVEAGKRLVRWGSGYAFTPTGLLDPPRTATDPQDRLGLNEGMVIAQATVFRGETALTIAAGAPRAGRPAAATAPQRLVAAKLRTSVHGFELALVASGADGRGMSAGANFTHVVGERLEWHGEWLAHERTSFWVARLDPGAAGERTMSALVGLQYTFSSGLNLVLEGYRDGNGLDAALWRRLVDGASASAAQAAAPATTADTSGPSRRDFLFVRAARSSSDARWKPELMAIVGADDGGLTLVPASAWTVGTHVDLYVRAVALTGARRSEARNGPIRATMLVGVAVRY